MLNTEGTRRKPSRRLVFGWRLLATLGLLLLILPAGALAGAQPAIVRPDPLLVILPVGGTTTVRLYVEDVQGLYGADVQLTFDPAILEVVDADPATAGVQIEPLDTFLKPDFLLRRRACNTVGTNCPEAGTIWYAATQVNPSEPVDGSGALARITFKRLQPGDAALAVTHHELVKRTGADIPAVAQDGLITVRDLPARAFFPLLLP